MARIKFAHEQYESYYWNYVDNYVSSQGHDTDFRLHDVSGTVHHLFAQGLSNIVVVVFMVLF